MDNGDGFTGNVYCIGKVVKLTLEVMVSSLLDAASDTTAKRVKRALIIVVMLLSAAAEKWNIDEKKLYKSTHASAIFELITRVDNNAIYVL